MGLRGEEGPDRRLAPDPYQAPLFRRLGQSEVMDPHVVFLTDFGVSPYYDRGFDLAISYDTPLTEGYSHHFVTEDAASLPRNTTFPGFRFLRMLVSERYDVLIVHGHAQVASWLGCLIAFVRGTPFMLRCDTQADALTHRRGLLRLARPWPLGLLMHRAAVCLAVGSRNARFYEQQGVPKDRIVWAPHSIDNNLFSLPPGEAMAAREKVHVDLGLDPSRRTILFVGKLQPYKRPLDVIEAVKPLAHRVNLIMVGDGPLAEEVVSGLGDIPNGRLVGFVKQSEFPELYAAADILVLPSDVEAWRLVVKESMAAGVVPVTTTSVGAADDFVEPSGGRTFPVGDIGRLSAILRSFVDQPDEFEDCRARAREVVDRFSIEETALAIEKAVAGLPTAHAVRFWSNSADDC